MAAGFPSMPGLPGLSRRGRSHGAMMAGLRPTAFWRFNDLASPPSDNSYDAAVIARSDTVALWDAAGANLKNPGTHTGTVNGNPVVVEGPLLGAANGGGALDLDGTGDWVAIPYNAALNPASFTVQAWIYRDTDTGGLEHVYDCRSSNFGYQLRITGSDKLELVLGDGAAVSVITGATSIPTGRWVHVGASFGSGAGSVYVDGIRDATGADAYSPNTSVPSNIGGYGSSLYFNGKIAKVSLHNAALTASEIAALFTKGRPVLDAMGNHPGGMIAAPTSATGAISGDTNACFDFDGSSAAVVVPYSAALNAATFSITGRIKRDVDSGAYETIVNSRSGGGVIDGYALYVQPNDTISFAMWNGVSGSDMGGSTALAVGTWYRVAATYDGTNRRLYINGALEATSAETFDSTSTGPLRIGVSESRTNWFNGKIDELTYHGGRVLTDAEILAQYRAGI